MCEVTYLTDAHLQRLAEHSGSSRYQGGVLSKQLLLCSSQHVEHTLPDQAAIKNLQYSPDFMWKSQITLSTN